MYQFSRSIYRQLSQSVVEIRPGNSVNHQRVLDACEGTIHRLATDRHYFARPARTLFKDIRAYFPIHEQLRVHQIVEQSIAEAIRFLDEQPVEAAFFDLPPSPCHAFTRKGAQCQRLPQRGDLYCPSHRHLAAEFDIEIESEPAIQERLLAAA